MIIWHFDTETEAGGERYRQMMKLDSPIFKAVEKEFDDWIESSNPANEYEEMYFGDEAIYSKKGAIRQAIEEIFVFMEENNLKFINVKDPRLDLDGIFAG